MKIAVEQVNMLQALLKRFESSLWKNKKLSIAEKVGRIAMASMAIFWCDFLLYGASLWIWEEASIIKILMYPVLGIAFLLVNTKGIKFFLNTPWKGASNNADHRSKFVRELASESIITSSRYAGVKGNIFNHHNR